MNLLHGFVPIKNTNMRYYINLNGDVFDDLKSRFISKHHDYRNSLRVRIVDDENEEHEIAIHRLVFATFSKLEIDQIVDHIDGNPENNHFDNLRIATHFENAQNRNPTNNRNLYKGVNRTKCGYYKSEINNDGHRHYLGTYSTPEAAAEAYNHAAIKFHGEFARINDYLPFAN